MSFCPASGNSGFVHLAGPLQPSEVKAISVASYFPLTFSFAPRTTPPTLLNSNQLDVDPSNTCVYLGRRYSLASAQVCAPLHKGYVVPGESPTRPASAELILTYVPSSSLDPEKGAPLEGIIVSLPIYESGTPAYDAYLDQIVNDADIACGYENQVGKAYEGEDQKTLNDASLRQCVKACCDDAQCLAYTFGKGTCHIKHSIPNLLSTGDDTISGKIRRDQKPACTPTPSLSTPTSLVSSLESLFYLLNGKTTHSVMAYKTCFESMSNNRQYTNTVYVLVFPKGIRMRPASYQQLVLRMNGTLTPYRTPPAIRRSGETLLRYRMENGKKIPLTGSDKGEVYTTTVSTCTEEFQERFEYFLLPSKESPSDQEVEEGFQGGPDPSCPSRPSHPVPYKCTPYRSGMEKKPYKCIPFDGKGGPMVRTKDGISLTRILETQREAKDNALRAQTGGDGSTVAGLSMGEIEGIVGGTIGGVLLLYLVYRFTTSFFNRPTD